MTSSKSVGYHPVPELFTVPRGMEAELFNASLMSLITCSALGLLAIWEIRAHECELLEKYKGNVANLASCMRLPS